MAGEWRWIIHGQDKRLTQMASVAGVVAFLCLGFLAVTWPPVVFVGFEIGIGLTGLALVCGLFAVRQGGSLLMSVWLVFIPVGAITFLVPLVNAGLPIPMSQLVELAGATLYVGLGAAIPGGLLVYAVGIRSRTGPWEGSLKNHLPTRTDSMSVTWVAVWLGIVATTSAALSIHIVNLGFSWFVLLLGGLAFSMFAGHRNQDATESVVLGLVTGAGLVLVSSIGFSSATATDTALRVAWMFLAALIAGLPIGILGYLAGRALAEDEHEISDAGKTDRITS